MTQAYRRKGRKILGTLAPEKSAAQANILRPELYMFVFGIKVLDFLRPHRLQKVCVSSKNAAYFSTGSGPSSRNMQLLQWTANQLSRVPGGSAQSRGGDRVDPLQSLPLPCALQSLPWCADQ